MDKYAGLYDNFENWQYSIEPTCWQDLENNAGNGYGMSLDCQLQFRMTIVQCEYMENKLGTTHSTCNILRSKIDCVKNMNTDVGVCADLLEKGAASTNMLEGAEI